jgi:hypothetical protein
MERIMFAISFRVLAVGLSIFIGLGDAGRAWAHCDGLDGPVVTTAREALESGDVNRVLIWVREEDEAEVKSVFNRAISVRKLGSDAKALADTSVFETVVRLHRAAEGASYAGLKPAGRDLGPAIPAADKAIETKSSEALVALLTSELREKLRAHFATVMAKKNFVPNDVAAGREYVEAYVAFVNFVERTYEATQRAPGGHYPEE